MARRLQNERGYSLVEVMASIVILSVAIIPMVGMFDMGLTTVSRGSNYDKARAFANERLERVKVLSYADARDVFPDWPNGLPNCCAPSPTATPAGSYTSSAIPAPTSSGLPSGATYTVVKQYVEVQSGSFQNSDTDSRMMRVTVTVNWSGASLTVSGVVAGGLV